MPAMIMVPQPLWRDFKERIRNSLATSKENLSDKAKKWEEREQVLGHMQVSLIFIVKGLFLYTSGILFYVECCIR